MTKCYEISPKKPIDHKRSDSEVRVMKLGAIHYLKQLGFSQVDIGTMVDTNRSKVQNALGRVIESDSPLKRKSPGRPTNLNDHTGRHLERIIRKEPFITNEGLSEELQLMIQPHSISTVKR